MKTPYLYILGAVAIVVMAIIMLFVEKESFIPTMDRTSNPMLIKFYIYPSLRLLKQAHPEAEQLEKGDKVYGFATWYEDEQDVNECQLHIVKPQHIDDEITLTWGHELLHCVYGLYHQ